MQRLVQDEARLGQRPLGCVDEQQHTVHHGQGPFHLPAEIGVARRVEDVDLDALPGDGAVFGGDGDAALPLQIHAVHEALRRLLAGAKDAGLTKECVYQGRLTVVDVGDDRDIAQALVGGIFVHGGKLYGNGAVGKGADVFSRPRDQDIEN